MSNSIDINKFNSFIDKANQTLSCGPQCQKEKTAEQLKQSYLNAQQNVVTAPYQEQVAQKNYVVFTEGELAYSQLQTQQLTQKVETIVNEFIEIFGEQTQQIKTQINSYNALLVNYNNVFELYDKYLKENEELNKSLKNYSSDVITNERKTYYEDQGLGTLDFVYYYILLIIYIITVICFVVFSFIYPSQTNFKVKIALTVVLVILPFVSTRILGSIIWGLNHIYNILPKNAYTKI
jgi:hypothetical protein